MKTFLQALKKCSLESEKSRRVIRDCGRRYWRTDNWYAYACQHCERPAYKWSVDVAVYVRQGYQAIGIGKQLYINLFERLREQNYFRAFAGITLPNAASVALHEGIGFKQLGIYQDVGFKLGQWHDVGWWEMTLQRLKSPPPSKN